MYVAKDSKNNLPHEHHNSVPTLIRDGEKMHDDKKGHTIILNLFHMLSHYRSVEGLRCYEGVSHTNSGDSELVLPFIYLFIF